MKINLSNEEINLEIIVYFNDIKPLDKKLLRPNIMGPVYYLPKLECLHSLVSMHHFVYGLIKYNNEEIKLNNAIGYMEKDYGTSMPKWWGMVTYE